MDIKSFFANKKSRILKMYKDNKKLFISVVICIIIAIILIFSTFFDLNKNKTKVGKSQKSEINISVSDFASEVESKLENLISKLDSVTSVSVFVMVESSPKITYLTETNEKIETKENNSVSEIVSTVVFEKNGQINTPIVVTTINPKITGVLIVTNKISPSTKMSIINSVSIVLNIDEHCISLLQES